MLIQLGRFQPFHVGHLEIARKAMEKYPNEALLIGVIVPHGPTKDHFSPEAQRLDEAATKRIKPEDNPWSALARVRAVRRAVAKELSNQAIEVIPVPRPETAWQFFTTLIPENRIWVLPEERDEFEQAKYNMYTAAGDKVCEVKMDRSIVSGTEIRDLLRNSQHDKVIEKLPHGVLEELGKDI
jgi:cytidyltransferase-like protein